MKSYLKLIPVLLLLVFGAVMSGSAMARGGHGGGGHASGGHSGGYSHGGSYVRGYGGVGLGIALAAPLYGLGYYSNPYYSYPSPYPYPPAAPYYYPPVAVTPAAPPVYIERQEQPQPQPQAQVAQNDWFYCTDSKSFYPYVQQCASEWRRVPSTPPR